MIDKYINSLEILLDLDRNQMPAKKKAPQSTKRTAANLAKEAHLRSFGRSLPMLLMTAREAVMQRFRPHLRRHDVTEQQWRILRVLAEEKNVDMQALSGRCNIQPPSLSRTIPLLVTRGLVRRCSHGNDQRRILVDLTPEGRSLFRTMSAESAEIYDQLQSDIGDARWAEIYRVLDFLSETADSRVAVEADE